MLGLVASPTTPTSRSGLIDPDGRAAARRRRRRHLIDSACSCRTSLRSLWIQRGSCPSSAPSSGLQMPRVSRSRTRSERALDQTLSTSSSGWAPPSDRTPHLFVVEDLHWADPSTLGLLGRLVDPRPRGSSPSPPRVTTPSSLERFRRGAPARPSRQACRHEACRQYRGGKDLTRSRASIVGLADGIHSSSRS